MDQHNLPASLIHHCLGAQWLNVRSFALDRTAARGRGLRYQVQTTVDLAGPFLNEANDAPSAVAMITTVTNPSGSPVKFYRVVRRPCGESHNAQRV